MTQEVTQIIEGSVVSELILNLNRQKAEEKACIINKQTSRLTAHAKYQ
jgi:hypothetical protein